MATITKYTATQIKKERLDGVEAWKDGELTARIYYRALGGYVVAFFNGDECTHQINNGLFSVAAAYSRLPRIS